MVKTLASCLRNFGVGFLDRRLDIQIEGFFFLFLQLLQRNALIKSEDHFHSPFMKSYYHSTQLTKRR
jgi:hypothetical protein